MQTCVRLPLDNEHTFVFNIEHMFLECDEPFLPSDVSAGSGASGWWGTPAAPDATEWSEQYDFSQHSNILISMSLYESAPHDEAELSASRLARRGLVSSSDGGSSSPNRRSSVSRRDVGLRGARWAVFALVLGVGLGLALRSPVALSSRSSYLSSRSSYKVATLSSVAGSELRPASAVMYVVRPGDTLWSIARSIDPTGDERPLVDRLASELHGTVIYPGEAVELPATP